MSVGCLRYSLFSRSDMLEFKYSMRNRQPIDVEMGDANGVRMITKPVASRPSRSFRTSFPESSLAPLADENPTSVEPKSSTPAAAAAARFRSASNYDDYAAKAVVVALMDDASETKETRTNTVLKPTAKPVSRTTASLLSNLGISVGSAQPVELANNPSAEQGKQNRELDARNRQQTRRDRPSCDGYNWRKYGQKQVKGSEYPRSYYKCTHPSCPVKKKVERSFDGQIAEIVYKGDHDHQKPRPPKRLSSGSQEQSFVGAAADENSRETGNLSWSTAGSPLEVNPKKFSRMPTSSVQVHLPAEHRPIDADCRSNADRVGGATIRVCRVPSRTVTKDHDMLIDCKRRKNEVQISGTNSSVGEDSTDPHSVIRTSIECNTSGDGYHWRKYGQKVMKGNSYPRSYYKCTSPKCNVRKYIERAFDDSDSIVTIYEGKHDHEMPPSR